MKSIFDKLIKCDRDKPYIFISYSSKDLAKVAHDVHRFQLEGYNVWLDEKDVDKTSSSWRAEALGAIQDINCELVLFYVSSCSLMSRACYEELSCTEDPQTKEIHFGSVRIAAVELEPIDDIHQYGKELNQQIKNSVGIPKDKRTEQAITLTRFLNQFFPNDKIRIRPIDTPNRVRDYYKELFGYFPAETRIGKPTPEASDQSTAAETPEQTPLSPDKPEPTSPPKKQTNREACIDFAIQRANAKFKETNCPWIFKSAKECTPKQRLNSCIHLAKKKIIPDQILAFQDTSIFHLGKTGILITADTIYLKELFESATVELAHFIRAELDEQTEKIRVIYRDGSQKYLPMLSCCIAGALEFLNVFLEAQNELMRQEQNADIQALIQEFIQEENEALTAAKS